MSDERPPGWYPDPFGTQPDDRRYWDGETWLASTPPSSPTTQSVEQHEPQGWQSGWQQPADEQAWSWQSEGLPRDRVVTPDGVRLARWGRRLAAYLVDAILLGIATAIIAWPTGVYDAMGGFLEQLESATTQAEITALQTSFMSENAAVFAVSSLLSIAVSALYSIGMVATRGATLGKMALGIGVRLRDREGVPGWRVAAVRWLVQFGPGLLSSVPVISYIASLFQIVDGLRPIWDLKRQAIHDKAARTNVVVRRG